MKAALDSLVPYLRRGFRVLAYGAIPVIALWLTDQNTAMLIVGLRVAGSAALLALLDKKRMSK